MSSVTSPLRP
ncbi:unnamed protein product, partial [Vitis vinifera]